MSGDQGIRRTDRRAACLQSSAHCTVAIGRQVIERRDVEGNRARNQRGSGLCRVRAPRDAMRQFRTRSRRDAGVANRIGPQSLDQLAGLSLDQCTPGIGVEHSFRGDVLDQPRDSQVRWFGGSRSSG